MGIVLNWYRKLGYRKDPFVDKPTKKVEGLQNLKNKINLFLLKNEQLAIIRGEEGSGKSSLVKWMDKELQFKRKVHNIDLRVLSSREKLETYLDSMTRPFYKQLLKDERKKDERLREIHSELQKRAYLLVIEDARLLNSAHITLLDQLLEKSKLQVMLLDTPENLRKNPLTISPSISTTIPKYKDEELEKMLRGRIEGAGSIGIFPFDKKMFHNLTAKAKSNPRELLKLARDKAMELSLKNLELPKKEAKGDKEQSGRSDSVVKKAEKKAFNLFGKIKFEFSDEPTQKDEEPEEDEDKEEPPEPEKKRKDKKEEVEDATIDADLLREIVEGK